MHLISYILLQIDSIISEELVQRCYSLLTTTSPSALLMASLEATIDYFASTEGHSRLADAVAASSLLKSSLRLQGKAQHEAKVCLG